MKSRKSYILNGIFMLALIAAVFYVLLRDQDIGKILDALRHSSPLYISLEIAAMLMFFILQSLSCCIILKALGSPLKFMESLKLTFTGFFYNSITPSAGGGQPMQVYYMRDDDIPVGTSTVTLIFWTTIYKIALLSIQAVMLIFAWNFIFRALGPFWWLYVLGIGVNLFNTALYLTVVFYSKGVRVVMRGVTWLLAKLHIVKKKKKFQKKVEDTIDTYAECSRYIGKHMKMAAAVLGITIVQRLVFFSIAFFSIRALGVGKPGFMEALILQSLVNVCIDIMPVPGGAGMNEGFFVTIFGKYMSKQSALSAMLLNRGVTFYIMTIAGAFVSIACHMRHIRISGEKKRAEEQRKKDKEELARAREERLKSREKLQLAKNEVKENKKKEKEIKSTMRRHSVEGIINGGETRHQKFDDEVRGWHDERADIMEQEEMEADLWQKEREKRKSKS